MKIRIYKNYRNHSKLFPSSNVDSLRFAQEDFSLKFVKVFEIIKMFRESI